jgi:LemA protein
MSPGLIAVLAAALVFLLWLIGTFNGLVRLRNFVKESWAQIDTELKRRYDLIPNLVETVKGYAKHEREVLERVTAARNTAAASNGTPAEQAKDENALVGTIKTLFAVSERYPDLKANEGFLRLQDELANTEDRIQAARRFYNGNVRDLNTRIEVFPSSLIAGIFGFQRADFFEVEEVTVRAAPAVSLST